MMTWEMKERKAELGVTILELSGKLTLGEGVEPLKERLQSLVAQGEKKMLLKCTQVSLIDSTGIGTLVRGFVSLDKRGGQLKLLQLSPTMRTALQVLGLVHRIESFEDENTALASFR